MVIWIESWCGTYPADMLIRQVHYDAPALFERGGDYGALLFATPYQGPLIGPIGNSGISSEAERTAP